MSRRHVADGRDAAARRARRSTPCGARSANPRRRPGGGAGRDDPPPVGRRRGRHERAVTLSERGGHRDTGTDAAAPEPAPAPAPTPSASDPVTGPEPAPTATTPAPGDDAVDPPVADDKSDGADEPVAADPLEGDVPADDASEAGDGTSEAPDATAPDPSEPRAPPRVGARLLADIGILAAGVPDDPAEVWTETFEQGLNTTTPSGLTGYAGSRYTGSAGLDDPERTAPASWSTTPRPIRTRLLPVARPS